MPETFWLLSAGVCDTSCVATTLAYERPAKCQHLYLQLAWYFMKLITVVMQPNTEFLSVCIRHDAQYCILTSLVLD